MICIGDKIVNRVFLGDTEITKFFQGSSTNYLPYLIAKYEDGTFVLNNIILFEQSETQTKIIYLKSNIIGGWSLNNEGSNE